MILLHVASSSEKIINEIADFLLVEKLVLDAIIFEKAVLRKKAKDNSLVSESQFVLTAKTKALLFETIDEKLKEKYTHNMPLCYSVPIVNMNWEQSKELQGEITKV